MIHDVYQNLRRKTSPALFTHESSRCTKFTVCRRVQHFFSLFFALLTKATLIQIWGDVLFVFNFSFWIKAAMSARQFDFLPSVSLETANEQVSRGRNVFFIILYGNLSRCLSVIIQSTWLYLTIRSKRKCSNTSSTAGTTREQIYKKRRTTSVR